jgi:hypothetical protein
MPLTEEGAEHDGAKYNVRRIRQLVREELPLVRGQL